MKVLLLSLSNAASGSNLTQATHVILVDPLAGSREHAQAYEAQAIGRAHRQGTLRNQKLKVVRLIVRDTPEETLFLRNLSD